MRTAIRIPSAFLFIFVFITGSVAAENRPEKPSSGQEKEKQKDKDESVYPDQPSLGASSYNPQRSGKSILLDKKENSGTPEREYGNLDLNNVFKKNAQEAVEGTGAVQEDKFTNLTYSGYVRMYSLYRNMDEYYSMPPQEGLTLPQNISMGDGYQEPLFLARIEATPTAKTWFQMEYYLNNRLLRVPPDNPNTNRTDKQGRAAKVYRIFQFTGGIHTRNGSFKLIAGGGVNWYRLSPFTLWNFQYRDFMFNRYPWEPEGNDWDRYNSFYHVGDIPRDQRWGRVGTQGFILEATNLPLGFGASLVYGKNEQSGGFQTFLNRLPANMLAGRVDKQFGRHKIGVNYFNEFGYNANEIAIDTLRVYNEDRSDSKLYKFKGNYTTQKIVTTDMRLNFDHLKIFGEMGVATYNGPGTGDPSERPGMPSYHDSLPEKVKSLEAPTDKIYNYKHKWGPLALLDFKFDEELTQLPVQLKMFHISKDAVNNSSTIHNTSVEREKAGPNQAQQYNITYFEGMVTEFDQLANNRQGINLKLRKTIDDFKVSLGLSASQEIDNLYDDPRNGYGTGRNEHVTNSITFQHWLASLSRSRFAFYQRFTGPYNRVMSVYRRTFENLAITDPDSTIDYKKSFNTLELSVKQKTQLFGNDLLLSGFANYNSVQDHFSPTPLFNNDAFLRYIYGEFMAFYHIHPKVTVLGFYGIERAKGNRRTELADEDGNLITDSEGAPVHKEDEGKPIDQEGHAYGVGLDYNFKSNASLNVRHRWYDHKGKNFTRDVFSGNELTVELKIFF